jgi:hypothetical protein
MSWQRQLAWCLTHKALAYKTTRQPVTAWNSQEMIKSSQERFNIPYTNLRNVAVTEDVVFYILRYGKFHRETGDNPLEFRVSSFSDQPTYHETDIYIYT